MVDKMNEMKRKRVRAIIFSDNMIFAMYRELGGRVFYAFPGGGVEGDESEQECVKREVLEEFGVNIRVVKKVYVYESEKSIEFFYTCEWLSGEFGSGTGEEFQEDRNNGIYKPMLIKISDIPSLPLMPPEIANNFFNDYSANGKLLRNDIIFINKN